MSSSEESKKAATEKIKTETPNIKQKNSNHGNVTQQIYYFSACIDESYLF